MPTTHYDTLGVSNSASTDEIKKAYRKLCMQFHPDVASSSSSSVSTQSKNAEKFKHISEAYSILGNDSKRRRYNFDISESGIQELRKRAAAAAKARGTSGGGGNSFAATLPRNVLIGGILGIVGVTLIRSIMPDKENDDVHHAHTGKKRMVEAWLNPTTNRWEKPRPWDKEYQRIKPVLQFVPRDQVDDGKR
jgi:curved DNA-binding protein CbpA